MNDKTVTIYNYHKADKVENWHRTVVSGLEYRYTTAKTVSTDGKIVLTPILTLIIPIEADAEGKQYIDYPSYLRLSSEELRAYWTINPKCNKEIIVCGVCDKEISADYRVTQLKEDYLKAGVIAAMDDNTEGDLLKHWKVVCR